MKKIAVLGSVNMDLAATSRRIPRKGETVCADTLQYLPGGKGANQAVAAARLGGDVSFFGCVGDDAFGTVLLDGLRNNNVGISGARTLRCEASGLAMIVVAESDNAITVVPGANARVTPAYLDEVWPELERADIVLLQNEIPADTVLCAAQRLREQGKLVLYNPAPAREVSAALIDCVTYLTPNEHEARAIFSSDALPEELAMRYPNKLIITLGEDGVMAADGERLLRIPAFQANVTDTTGAGDTFNGAFAYALSCEMSFEDSLRFASAAASLSVEKPGAQGGMPKLDAVKARLRQNA